MAEAQPVKITGSVADSAGAGLERVSVSVIDSGNQGYLFTMTGPAGRFALSVPDSLFRRPLYIKFSAIGYDIEKLPLSGQSSDLVVTLLRRSIVLPPVVVQPDPRGVRIGSDTTYFKTENFREAEDRVIADVISKIPGMTVSAAGQIKFNGKPITTVYLDGENVLDGNYKMATNNLPAGMVDEVQVIERDQPVKALNGYIASANTALNLKLGSKARLVTATTGEMAGGNKGGELNAFNIILDKKIKALSELKANTIGTDNGSNAGFSVASNTSGAEWGQFRTYLSDRAGNNPSVAEKYYLRNKDIMAGTNLFYKYSSDLSLRFALQGEWNRRRYNYEFVQQYFLPADTVTFSEIQDRRRTEKRWNPRFDIELNSKKRYLKSVSELILPDLSGDGQLTNNGKPFSQSLSADSYSAGNATTIVQPAGKNRVIQYNSLLQYYKTSERLDIEPGGLAGLVNAGNPYSSLHQSAGNRNILVSQRLLLRGKIKHAAFAAGGGIGYKREILASQLYYTEDDNSYLLPVKGNYANDAVFGNLRIYGSAEAILAKNRDYLTIGIVSEYNINRVENRLGGDPMRKNSAGNNPYINYRKQLGRYGELIAAFRSTLQLGTIADIYTGNLLVNYREIIANAVPLPVTKEMNGALSFFYKKPLRMLFYNASLSWTRTRANYTPSYQVTDGVATLVSTDRKNYRSFYTMSGSLSKYLFDLKTNLGLSGSLQWLEGTNFLNGELVPYSLLKCNLGLAWRIKVTHNLHLSGSLDEGKQVLRSQTGQHTGKTKAGGQHVGKILLQLKYVPVEKLIIMPSFNMYSFRRSSGDLSASFFDFTVIYRPVRIKGELQFSGTNIGGSNVYRDGTILFNSVASSSVPLIRNRLLLKYLFSL